MSANQIPFLDKTVALRIKGIAAIYIMLSHLIHSPYWQLEFFLFGGGYLFVGIFFFYSGYGLKKSTKSRQNYLNDFLKRKLIGIYLPFLLAETCHTVVTALYSGNYSQFIMKCIGVKLSNTILWYVVEILALYVLFYIFETYRMPIIAYVIAWLGFAFVASYFNIGSWWYVSTPCFILGIICGKYESRLSALKRVWGRKVGSLVIFFITDYLHRWIAEFKISLFKIPSTYICVALMIISAMSFVIALILNVEEDFLKTRIFDFCGELSYLIYLWHGFFITLISRILTNDFLLTIEVTVITLLFAALYHRMKTKIFKKLA